MNAKEKAEMLKGTITQLYSNEGRSVSYISRLLEINRKTLSESIREWNLEVAVHRRYATPSTQKFINKHKQFIISGLNADVSISEIARELNVSRDFLQRTVLACDDDIREAADKMVERIHENAVLNRQKKMDSSSLNYISEDLEGEIWKPVLGYEDYEISNMGRIRAYAKRLKAYYELRQNENSNSHRMYVMLFKDGKRKTLQVARLVANTFVEKDDPEKNTVNHIDGNVKNNRADNLEWATQSDNNTHSYRVLDRVHNSGKRYVFKEILYMKKYRFKTIAAFARFLGMSETQTRRYLDEPEKHDIILIK